MRGVVRNIREEGERRCKEEIDYSKSNSCGVSAFRFGENVISKKERT